MTFDHRLCAVALFFALTGCGGAEDSARVVDTPDDGGVSDAGMPDGSSPDAGADTGVAQSADEVYAADLGGPRRPVGLMFRAINLDANKQLPSADADRLDRLLCGAQSETCSGGAVRSWLKVRFGRFAMEQPGIAIGASLERLFERGHAAYVTVHGTPAFLAPSCTGCVVSHQGTDYHLLRPVSGTVPELDNLPVECVCSEERWQTQPPVVEARGGVTFEDYVADRVTRIVATDLSGKADLKIGIWNEPDGPGFWDGDQAAFLQTLGRAVDGARRALVDVGRADVALGGPDIAVWDAPIRNAGSPLLESIMAGQDQGLVFDFLTYHDYFDPGRYLYQNSVEALRTAGAPAYSNIPIDVGEYGAQLGHGAERATPCDVSAIPKTPDEQPVPTGEVQARFCDHRGAAEQVALVSTLASQDHRRLYVFEAFDWGAEDYAEARLGLLTTNGLPRPMATVFWMTSHLGGELIPVDNRMSGAHPFHVMTSVEGEQVTIIVAAQNLSASELLARGLLRAGYTWAEDVEPAVAAACVDGNGQSTIDTAGIDSFIASRPSADAILERCPTLSSVLAIALSEAADFAAPRVGHEGSTFRLEIDVPGLQGEVTRHRMDPWHNTTAEAWREWQWSVAPGNRAAAEQHVWDYLTTPIDRLVPSDGKVTIEVPPDSVTMLRGTIPSPNAP